MRSKLIVFDIDDTLYDELDYVKSGYNVVSKYIEKKYRVNKVYERLTKLFQKSSKNVFNRLLDSLNIEYTKEDIIYLVEMYRNHTPNIKLSNDVIKTLKELRNNYKLAIVSDGNYKTQKLKVDALGLMEYFDKIVLTDKHGKEYWKPNIKSFEMLSNDFKIEFCDIYYVGDNPNKDFYFSKYGIKTIRYYNKNGIYYNDKYLENIKENYRIDSIKEVIDVVGD